MSRVFPIALASAAVFSPDGAGSLCIAENAAAHGATKNVICIR
jgi:hypothetical protein